MPPPWLEANMFAPGGSIVLPRLVLSKESEDFAWVVILLSSASASKDDS